VLDPRFEDVIAEGGYDLVGLDPWATFYTGSENSNDEVEAALDKLRDLSIQYGPAIWLNHHFSQRGVSDKIDPEDAWRGASRLADWATTRITLTPHFTPRQAQKRGLSRIEARRYMDVRFLTRGAPITISRSIAAATSGSSGGKTTAQRKTTTSPSSSTPWWRW
jgi:RecA-family ATPase